MTLIIMVNTWRGLRSSAISILAGCRPSPSSCTVGDHRRRQHLGRFRYVTCLAATGHLHRHSSRSILTFFDFQLVYVLTGGGPANSTHLMATYAQPERGRGPCWASAPRWRQHGAGAGAVAGAAHLLREEGCHGREADVARRLFGMWAPAGSVRRDALFPFTWMAANLAQDQRRAVRPKRTADLRHPSPWCTTSACSRRRLS